MEENLISERRISLAVKIVRMYQHLSEHKREFILSKQLVRSGTSIAANISEAIGGISRADFSAKMSIAC
jgi:four helix bundle protein